MSTQIDPTMQPQRPNASPSMLQPAIENESDRANEELAEASDEQLEQAADDFEARAKEALMAMEDKSRAAMERMGRAVKKPATGAAIAGAAVLGAAATWGLIETALGAGAAYVVYRALRRKGRAPRVVEQRPVPPVEER